MIRPPIGLFLILLFSNCQPALQEDEHLLENMMKRETAKFKDILQKRNEWEVQIIYTQINRDSANRPSFKSFYFNVDSTRYFYPASTVKLPLVLLALEKINQLKIQGLDRATPMFHEAVYSGQSAVEKDSTSENGLPSVEHYSKKILVVSDNDAFNRLYEFMGQKETNRALREKGYNMRILHRLERALTPDENRHTEQVRFVKNDTVLFLQPMLVNTDSIKPMRKVLKGTGYMRKEELVRQPFDFTYKNDYPLQEQQEILKAILFPEYALRAKFEMTSSDRAFVMQYMSQLPAETNYPAYAQDTSMYDAYCKFLMYGQDREPIPTNIRIFNKVGDAYGYLIDNAYVVDFENKVEFMLSAVINTNTDGVYNDGQYEYKTLGYPFMKNIGQTVYQYELKRKRKYPPDLSEFRLSYEKLVNR